MTSKKGPPPVVYLIILFIVGFGGYQALRMFRQPSEPTITPTESESLNNNSTARETKPTTPTEDSSLSNHFSTGDKLLIDSIIQNQTFLDYKKRGIDALAAKNYPEAVQQFEAALKENRNSPETLIYLNNARIGEQSAFEIAVTVPVDEETVYFALEMLRGYAQAQQEINQAGGINGTPLRLVIADDDDNPDIAMKVAQELANRPEILAVTGHWSSGTTLAVTPIYEKNQLVLVNPVSTSTKISQAGDYIFRTIPSNFVVGATMADYALNELQVQQVAIFYDSRSSYSLSLRQEVKTSLATRGGRTVAEFDLSQGGILVGEQLKAAQNQGAEAIILIPSPNIDRALQVINVNNRNLPLIGDIGNLYGIKTLQVGGEDAVGMALPIPWHIQQPGSQEFVQTSRQLWGGDVNWATVMAYEAMSAIAQALEQNPTREGVQNALSSNGFSAEGVLQPIKFLPSGDRDGRLIMVEVQPANPSRSGTGYDFVPVN
ncbi:MAG: ABC transporter substrate-binding protein [Halothece sp. Uz-M2-17]|nr:ABC transporter substrate-binding protein [Halothece sp. Uz-M2-17]